MSDVAQRAAEALLEFAKPDAELGWVGLPCITDDIAMEIAGFLAGAGVLE